MGEDVGQLEVKYHVISDEAMRKLEALQAQLDNVEDNAEKSGMGLQAAFKKAGVVMAAFGAITVGTLYAIIKSSSYASMWMDQLKYTTMRLADEILEMTGLDDDIEDLLSIYDDFVDNLQDPGITVGESIKMGIQDLIDWFMELDGWKQVLILLGAGIIALGIIITVFTLLLVPLSLVFSVLTGAISLATTASTLFGAVTWTVLWPLTLLVLAILAVSAAMIYLYVKSGALQQDIKDFGVIWTDFKNNMKDYGFITALGWAIDDFVQLSTLKLKFIADMFIAVMNPATVVKVPEIMSDYGIALDDFYDKQEKERKIRAKMAADKAHYDKYAPFVFGDETITTSVADGIDGNLNEMDAVLDYMTKLQMDEYLIEIDNANQAGKDIGSSFTDSKHNTIKQNMAYYNSLETAVEKAEFLKRIQEAEKNGFNIGDGIANGQISALPIIQNSLNSMGTQQQTIFDLQERHAYVHGIDTIRNLAEGIIDALPTITDAFAAAASEFDTYVGLANAAMGNLITEYTITVTTYYNSVSSGGSSSGSSSGNEYEGWDESTTFTKSAEDQGFATGGHVLRSGAAVVHQGEDIVNLKSLMSGMKSGHGMDRDIIVNNTINITSGDLRNSGEVNHVASIISKRMSEELRRISTSI